jgi:hypothetical protein
MRCWQRQTTRVPHPFAYFAKGWEIRKSEARVCSPRAGQESPADVSVRWLDRIERLVAFLGDCEPVHAHPPGEHDSTSFSVSDAFVDGGEGLPVFLVEDRRGIFEIKFARLRHNFIVGRIFDRCNENRRPRQRRSHPFAKSAKGWGTRPTRLGQLQRPGSLRRP